MATPVNDNIKVQAPKPIDDRYDNAGTAYTNVAAANAATAGRRYPLMPVNISGVEYWYKNGIADGDLVIKSTSDPLKADLVSGKVPQSQSQGSTLTYDSTLGKLTLVDARGVSQIVDFTIENLFEDAAYNSSTQVLTLTTNGGGTVTIDLSTLLDLPEVAISPSSNPSVAPTSGQKLYYRADNGKYWVSSSGAWAGPFLSVTQAEKDAWDNKVDKVTGKGLSTNDYTTIEKNKLALVDQNVSATEKAYWDAKQAALGYTPMNADDKQNSLATDGTGTKVATVDAVKAGIAAITISDATTTAKGIVKLAGDLAGTADAPTVPRLDVIAQDAIDYTDALGVQLIGGAPITADTLKKLHDRLSAQEAIVGGTTPDGDSIVNTVAELMAVLNTYPEGTDLFTLVQGKVALADVYNALDRTASGKVLDARQGKILNDLITALTTTVNTKAADNNVVKKTGQTTQTVNGEVVIDSGTNNISGLVLSRIPQTPITPTAYGTGLSTPSDVVTLSNGDALVSNFGNNAIMKIPAGGGSAVSYGTGLNNPRNMAVLSNGDVLVANLGANNIMKVASGGGAATVYGTGLNGAGLVALANGDVVFSSGSTTVSKIPAGGGTATVYGTGLNSPWGMALLPSGEIAVVSGSNSIMKIPSGGGAAVAYCSGLPSTPFDITSLANGDILATNFSAGTISKIAYGGTTITQYASGITSPYGINVAPNGDVLVASSNTLVKVGSVYSSLQKLLKTDSIGRVIKTDYLEDKPYAELVSGKIPSANSQPSSIAYNSTTGVITFTDATGTVQTIDLPVENLFQNASYNTSTQKLTLTTNGGGTLVIDLATLVDLPEVVVSAASNPSAGPTSGQRLYFRADTSSYWVASAGVWNGPFGSVDSSVLDAKENVINKVQHFSGHETDANAYPSVPAVMEADTVLQNQINSIINAVAVHPTYVAPVSSININNSLFEVGQSVTVNITQTFTQNDGGAKTTETISKNGSTVASASTFSETYSGTQGVNTYGGAVSYGQGAVKNNNIGIADPFGRINAGTTTTPVKTYEFVFPIFATTSSISTLTKQANVSMVTGNSIIYTLVSESGGNKQKIDIPTAWITARPLVGIQQLNTVSGLYEYAGGSAAASLALWTVSDVTQTIQSNTINYKRRTYNGSDRASVSIKLIF